MVAFTKLLLGMAVPHHSYQMALARLADQLGLCFSDIGLLQTALTHRSFGQPHNERLEFLGDGVLNCVIAAALYARFPDLPEGDLSRLRARLVRQDTLHQLAMVASLGVNLRLGEGEMKSGGQSRPSMLADAFEAIVGAVYLDKGFDAASDFVRRQFDTILTTLDPAKTLKDPKTRLQEWLQARKYILPKYSVQETTGAAHAQQFAVRCELTKPKLSSLGLGNSRRIAEQDAAAQLLAQLERTPT